MTYYFLIHVTTDIFISSNITQTPCSLGESSLVVFCTHKRQKVDQFCAFFFVVHTEFCQNSRTSCLKRIWLNALKQLVLPRWRRWTEILIISESLTHNNISVHTFTTRYEHPHYCASWLKSVLHWPTTRCQCLTWTTYIISLVEKNKTKTKTT